ncbi:unnamed protein product [Caenorhabditis sp. 36 PRJEB53466]|nr:unnamed protein product [Caenorhabditis sp. 36 PRJEB53466]
MSSSTTSYGPNSNRQPVKPATRPELANFRNLLEKICPSAKLEEELNQMRSMARLPKQQQQQKKKATKTPYSRDKKKYVERGSPEAFEDKHDDDEVQEIRVQPPRIMAPAPPAPEQPNKENIETYSVWKLNETVFHVEPNLNSINARPSPTFRMFGSIETIGNGPVDDGRDQLPSHGLFKDDADGFSVLHSTVF